LPLGNSLTRHARGEIAAPGRADALPDQVAALWVSEPKSFQPEWGAHGSGHHL
jgi:hypothetical protein